MLDNVKFYIPQFKLYKHNESNLVIDHTSKNVDRSRHFIKEKTEKKSPKKWKAF